MATAGAMESTTMAVAAVGAGAAEAVAMAVAVTVAYAVDCAVVDPAVAEAETEGYQ